MTLADFESVKQIPLEISALAEYRPTIIIFNNTSLEYRNSIDKMISARIQRIAETVKIIENVSDELSRDVLTAYLTSWRKTFETIADEQHYSTRTIQRAYKRGIDELIEGGFIEMPRDAQKRHSKRV